MGGSQHSAALGFVRVRKKKSSVLQRDCFALKGRESAPVFLMDGYVEHGGSRCESESTGLGSELAELTTLHSLDMASSAVKNSDYLVF